MAALQWAVKLFPFAHVPARYLCMLAAADGRFQVAEAALEGLQPGKFAGGGAGGASGSGNGPKDALPQHPAFEEVLQFLLGQVPQLGRRPADGAALPLQPKVRPLGSSLAAARFPCLALASYRSDLPGPFCCKIYTTARPSCAVCQAFLAAISFLEECRRQAASASHHGSNGGMPGDTATAYLQLLENALLPAAPAELASATLGALLAAAAAARSAFAAAYAADGPRQALLLRLTGHVDGGARQAAAQLLGMLVPHLGAGPDSRVGQLCDTLLSTLRAGHAARLEQADGAAAAAGFIAAHLLQGGATVASYFGGGGVGARPARRCCCCWNSPLLAARLPCW
jgi:proteasome component ECM29